MKIKKYIDKLLRFITRKKGGRMKTPEQFREQAIKLKLRYWEHHTCFICGEPVGYYFFTYYPYEVVFDSGCGCSLASNLHPASWEDVAEFYNLQTNPDVINKMNEFWKWEKQDEEENQKNR